MRLRAGYSSRVYSRAEGEGGNLKRFEIDGNRRLIMAGHGKMERRAHTHTLGPPRCSDRGVLETLLQTAAAPVTMVFDLGGGGSVGGMKMLDAGSAFSTAAPRLFSLSSIRLASTI